MTALTDLIARMKELGEELDAIDEKRKPLAKEYDDLRLVQIPSAMAEEDITSMKGGFGRCTLTSDLYVSVIPGQKQALHDWLTSEDAESLIQPTVNAQTLKAFCKERLKDDEDIPESILKVTPFSRAVIYKA